LRPNSLPRRAVATVAALTVVATMSLTGSANATARPFCWPATTITAAAPMLYPENGTWDPTRDAFLVGSARLGTVDIVETDGTARPFIPSLGPVSTLGVRVDVPRGRLLVVYTDYWVRQQVDTGRPPVSGLAVFDLRTGRQLRNVDLSFGPTPFANDLAVDWHGNAYVTDAASDTIREVDVAGHVTAVASDPRFVSTTVGLNGIVWDPRGFLLVGRYDKGELFRVSPRDHSVREVELASPIPGTDGLALHPDGTLVAAANTNGLPPGAGVDTVYTLRSTDDWRSAHVVRETAPWPVAGPTSPLVTPYGDYVLSGNIALLPTGGNPDTFTLRKF
jgi:hypothetical protein